LNGIELPRYPVARRQQNAILWFAAYVSITCGPETFNITIMGVDLGQQTFFVGVDHSASTSPCTRRDEFKWHLSSLGIKEIEAIALTAKTLGKQNA
jgi:hypothetical protein